MEKNQEKKTVDIDQNKLTEECLTFGIMASVLSTYVREKGIACSHDAPYIYTAITLLDQRLGSEGYHVAAFTLMDAYFDREVHFGKDKVTVFPQWDPDDHHNEDCHRLSDLFFVMQAWNYFASYEESCNPSDFLGPLFFNSGAINEDIAKGYHMDPSAEHYQKFEEALLSSNSLAKLDDRLKMIDQLILNFRKINTPQA